VMGAPRLVEYWEQDPCLDEKVLDDPAVAMGGMDAMAVAAPSDGGGDHGVKVEAQFAIGEYKIVILSAKESTGLATWLREQKYQIPATAEPLLRPYVEGGSKFFVAKVDPAKVKWVGEGNDKRIELSPLRFHYDSDEFALPIRLGLANSAGKQDLIVNILAPHQRYEVANYPNVRIPTNLDVRPAVKGKLAEFYAALFDRTVEKHPRAVVTEYAWDTSNCDPCPGPVLDASDLATLGADVLEGTNNQPSAYSGYDFVHTRLHARYGKELADDLRFRTGAPIAGGRENRGATGKLEEGAQPAPINNFQARYAIRYRWNGPITCERPIRERWGGPNASMQPAAQAVRGVAFAKRDAVQLATAVAQDIPDLEVVAAGGPPGDGARSPILPGRTPIAGGGCCRASASDSGGLLLSLGMGLWLLGRRRPRPRRAR
jgi:hypothetical protein